MSFTKVLVAPVYSTWCPSFYDMEIDWNHVLFETSFLEATFFHTKKGFRNLFKDFHVKDGVLSIVRMGVYYKALSGSSQTKP